MSTFFERAQKKAQGDRHWKQVEGGLTAAGAAAVIFIVKVAVEHLASPKTPPTQNGDSNSLVERLMRGRL